MSGRSPVQARLGTYARLPERSKGVDLRSTVFALVGSNPTPCKNAAAAARVAQWIRRGTSNPKTAGSSPAVGFFCLTILIINKFKRYLIEYNILIFNSSIAQLVRAYGC